MTEDPYADLGGHRESYAEALARSEACLNPPRTEQDDAAAIVAKREAQRQHDGYFAPYFISPVEEVVISRHLARKLGYFGTDARFDDEHTGEGWPE